MITMNVENKVNPTRKEKSFLLRVTPSELKKLHELAEKNNYSSTSKYILDCSFNPVLFVENIKPFIDIETNIAKIGTNINQIARKVNTLDYVMHDDLKEIKKNQLQLRAYLKLLKDFRFFEKAVIEERYTDGDD